MFPKQRGEGSEPKNGLVRAELIRVGSSTTLTCRSHAEGSELISYNILRFNVLRPLLPAAAAVLLKFSRWEHH